MSDWVISQIRTYVPVAVGVVLTWLATKFGIVLDEDTSGQVLAVVTGAVIAGYYALARVVERRYPAVGKWLLGSSKTPVYARPDAVVRVDGVQKR